MMRHTVVVAALALVALVLVGPRASADCLTCPLVFDRGLPDTYINNDKPPVEDCGDYETCRSNIAWADGNEGFESYFFGDDFTLAPGGSGTYTICKVRTWFVGEFADNDADTNDYPGTPDNPGDSKLGDWYDDVVLYVGEVGTSLSRVMEGDFSSGSDQTDNANIRVTRVQYGDLARPGELDYEDLDSAPPVYPDYYSLYMLEFTNLNLTYTAGSFLQFGVQTHSSQWDLGMWAFNHASNADLSGTPQEGADNKLRWMYENPDGTASFWKFFETDDPTYNPDIGRHWDKKSDMNVQVFACQTAPEPMTLLLLGSGVAGLVGFGRARRRR